MGPKVKRKVRKNADEELVSSTRNSSNRGGGSSKKRLRMCGCSLKIMSWNVAGLRAWLKKGCFDDVRSSAPEIIAFQETKVSVIPEELLVDGYHTYLNSSEKNGYAGVISLFKEKPLNVTYGFRSDKTGVASQCRGRLIIAEFETFFFVNAYVPNSGRGLVNLALRKKWDDAFINELKTLDSEKSVICTGDLNVSHEEIDLANPKTNRNKTAGFTDQERNDFSRLLAAGFTDVYRHLNPEKKGAYTFWSRMHNARAKNVGWRLDYFVVSNRILNKVNECNIISEMDGSDHCPIVLRISA